MPTLSLIIPCYFDDALVADTAARLRALEPAFPSDTVLEYIWVDDGSTDDTWKALQALKASQPERNRIIRLAKNVGSYTAIVCGMAHATGDCCAVIASDLQDPPELLPQMYSHWHSGFKLVIAHRQGRKEGWLTKALATTFQHLIRRFALPNLPRGGFDFVLFDASLKEVVVQLQEKNTNSLYLLLWTGHTYVSIPYTRQPRTTGKSKWTLSKKLKLFVDSFVAFSFFPVRLISTIGLLLGILALGYGVFVIIARLTGMITIEGWTALMVVLLFVSAFQMIALGILGEYIWRVLDQVRGRPNYLVLEKEL